MEEQAEDRDLYVTRKRPPGMAFVRNLEACWESDERVERMQRRASFGWGCAVGAAGMFLASLVIQGEWAILLMFGVTVLGLLGWIVWEDRREWRSREARKQGYMAERERVMDALDTMPPKTLEWVWANLAGLWAKRRDR